MNERLLLLFFQFGLTETFSVPFPVTYETHCTDKPADNNKMCTGHVYPFYQRCSDTDLIPEHCAFADTHSQANPSVLNRIMCYLLYSCILLLYGC